MEDICLLSPLQARKASHYFWLAFLSFSKAIPESRAQMRRCAGMRKSIFLNTNIVIKVYNYLCIKELHDICL